MPDSLFGDYSGTVVVKSGKDTVVSDLPLRISVSAGQSESTMTITTNPISIAGVEAVSSLKFEDCMVLSYDGAYMFSYESESMNVGVLGDASVIFTGILSLEGKRLLLYSKYWKIRVESGGGKQPGRAEGGGNLGLVFCTEIEYNRDSIKRFPTLSERKGETHEIGQ